MALNLTIDDVVLVSLNISSSESGANLVLNFDADWLALDSEAAALPLVGQQKDSESKLFSEYPQEIQDAVIVLNAYAKARIKAAKKIS